MVAYNERHIIFTTVGKYSDNGWEDFRKALLSWRDQTKFSGCIVVYGDEGDEDGKSFVEGRLVEFRTDVERTEFGLPFVRSLFKRTEELYPDALTYTYVNSDIIFDGPFEAIIDQIMDIEDQFMLVGQRTDVFKDGTERLHNPGGIDYFCYTKGFWDLSDMPDFSIARGRFDHYLMGRALRYGKGPVIDITDEFKVIHPEPMNRKPGDVNTLYQRGEFALGYQVLKNHYYFANAKLHGQTNYAPFKYKDGSIYKDNSVYTDEFNQVIKNDILL